MAPGGKKEGLQVVQNGLKKKKKTGAVAEGATKAEKETDKAPMKDAKVEEKPTKEGKPSAKEPAPKSELSEEQRQELEAKAIKEMLIGLAKEDSDNPSVQVFIPKNWSTRFKPELGAYKRFAQKHPDKFIVETLGSGDFTLKLQKGVAVKGSPSATQVPWQNHLLKAWHLYNQLYPRSKRDFREFIAALPEDAPGRRAVVGGTACATTSEAEGGDAAGDAEGKKKKKRKGAPSGGDGEIENDKADEDEDEAAETSKSKSKGEGEDAPEGSQKKKMLKKKKRKVEE
eukprot:NODE_11575_length_1277_cov_5.035652.p1 GENE.NODE_11575_length_1277_cov_5.035652~~NODE_11575_length_1277_cov_5.035652.p1  ORF type:complete len:285 (+),score=97.43 NODE_11575_length_1277_cov_5.035652:89-943(+)